MTSRINTRFTLMALMLASGAISAPPSLAKSLKPAVVATPAASLRTTIDGHFARYRYTDIRNIPPRYHEFENSPALQALFDRAGGGLDYDVYCGCQEYEEDKFRYTILSTKINGRRADVNMQVFPFYNDDGRRITLKFLRNAKGIWQVNDVIGDVTDAQHHRSLQATLRAMAPEALRVE